MFPPISASTTKTIFDYNPIEEEMMEYEQSGESDSDEAEDDEEIAQNAEKYIAILHSILLSPITDQSPPSLGRQFTTKSEDGQQQQQDESATTASMGVERMTKQMEMAMENGEKEEAIKTTTKMSIPPPPHPHPPSGITSSSSSASSASPFVRSPSAVAPPLEVEQLGKDASSSSSSLPHQSTAAPSSPNIAVVVADSAKPNPLASSPSADSQVVVVVRERPAIPPKPQLDVVRFSMAQAQDEVDLDTILSELLELETQLSGEAGDRFVFGLPSLPATQKQPQTAQNERPQQHLQLQQQQQHPAPPPNRIFSAPVEQMAKRVQFQQFIHETDSARIQPAAAAPISADFCVSPDADSAFGDSSSTESAHPPMPNGGGNGHLANGRHPIGGRNSEFSSADSFRGSLNTTPSPTHHQVIPSQFPNVQAPSAAGGELNGHNRPPSSADSLTSAVSSKDEQQKKAKIREALEKMKEAKMKKVFVKIFLEDGSQRGLLVDERWTVSETMRQLADKINCQLSQEHAIVEEYPHLHIKRVYEDHEFVVENLEEWTADSPNKLHFLRLPNKWTIFRHPQHFLLTDRNRNEFPAAEDKAQWDRENNHRLLEQFIRDDGAPRVPEMEGWLLLKADGKKSWRRHFFVLRASGLYYVAKQGKCRGPTRDLQCLMSVFNNQVYTCTDWRKKYKAPNDWGFAIKHPRIQVKTSKYIKYICAEDEHTFLQWVTALRIIKNGCPTLYKNYCSSTHSQSRTSAGPSTPVRVEVPQVPLQRLSALDPASFLQSPLHRSQQPSCTNSIGFASPVTLRASFVASRASGESNSSRLASPIHVGGFAFDQDQCNTIKRQPDSIASIHQQNNFISKRRQLECGRLGTPTSSAMSLETNGAAGAESDSDEEQFPPPPLVEAVFESPRRSAALPPQCHPKESPFVLPSSPWRTNPNSNGKFPPPPPPKRAEGTRIHSAASNSAGLQMDLFAELQMATNKQKMRMEQNL